MLNLFVKKLDISFNQSCRWRWRKRYEIVEEESDLENLFLTAKLEAKKFFGKDELYIEKYFKNPRHIEVQIMSGKNKTVHLEKEIVQCKEDIKN